MKKRLGVILSLMLVFIMAGQANAGMAGYLEVDSFSSGSPFPPGVAGSENFRIPAFKVLSDGSLFAAADARYETLGDGGGLDTLVAFSEDMGESWRQSFAVHYPDSAGFAGNLATTCIDPVVCQGEDGTVFVLADMNPTGVTTAGGFQNPGEGTGYMYAEGKLRLALTDDYSEVNNNPALSPYPYFLGDEENGFFPVLYFENLEKTEWVLDKWWNIYTYDREGEITPLYQTQVNSDKEIQQNVYYKDSVLHLYNTGYMLLVSSDDKGKTWEPQVLNASIKRDNETALLVSPGKGTLTSDGRILIPFYNWETGKEPLTQSVSFIWSNDNGKTWTRTEDVPSTEEISWCSESEIVEINNGVLRTFMRNGTGRICYADALWSEEKNNYIWENPVMTDVKVCSSCNLTANKYSGKIDGKTAVMVACPTGKGRTDGKIFTFLLEEDNSMKAAYACRINSTAFGYSCMDELPDGSMGILYEEKNCEMIYKSISPGKLTAHGISFELYVIILCSAAGGLLIILLAVFIIKKIIGKQRYKNAETRY